MGMENQQYVSNPHADVTEEQFTDVEIEIGEKSQLRSDEINHKTDDDDEEEDARRRIGGILHPNEKLPRPEPPRGVTQERDGVEESQAVNPTSDGEKDGLSVVGRFIRQRSSTIAWLMNRTEETEGNENDVVVTELNLPGVKVIVQEKSATANGGLKGRVTFFSRSNCRDCGAVREKGLSYVEINLDVYPTRAKELEERTRGSSTVPKIFFNAKLIGGLAELNEMRRSGDLHNKLKELLAGKCPDGDASVPTPPVYGFDSVAADDSTDEMIGIVRILKQRLPIQDRMIKLRNVINCFVASELAVEIGKNLVKKHFIHPVFGEHEFEDGNHIYRLLEHEPYIPKCYNFRGSTDELEPKNAFDISRRLSKIMSAILESFASDDKQFVDYMAISNSEEFRRYLNLVHGLQRVDILTLSTNEKLAFFLNLHNAMVIHAVIRLGNPQGMMDRKSMANDFQYLVGGQPYSLNAIKNGVLRGNRRPPYSLSKPFAYGDKRSEVALPKVNPLIHFGLCDGSRSAPTVRFFTPENVEAELRLSTRDFFSKGSIEVDLVKRTVYLSSIIKWFSADFGSEKEILNWVISYLDGSNAGLVTHLLGDYGSVKIMYQSYDWSLNS
ncbi:hypothetical protein V2J09_017440 [Rumex salicifolius]